MRPRIRGATSAPRIENSTLTASWITSPVGLPAASRTWIATISEVKTPVMAGPSMVTFANVSRKLSTAISSPARIVGPKPVFANSVRGTFGIVASIRARPGRERLSKVTVPPSMSAAVPRKVAVGSGTTKTASFTSATVTPSAESTLESPRKSALATSSPVLSTVTLAVVGPFTSGSTSKPLIEASTSTSVVERSTGGKTSGLQLATISGAKVPVTAPVWLLVKVTVMPVIPISAPQPNPGAKGTSMF